MNNLGLGLWSVVKAGINKTTGTVTINLSEILSDIFLGKKASPGVSK
jgi:hypothetical protein